MKFSLVLVKLKESFITGYVGKLLRKLCTRDISESSSRQNIHCHRVQRAHSHIINAFAYFKSKCRGVHSRVSWIILPPIAPHSRIFSRAVLGIRISPAKRSILITRPCLDRTCNMLKLLCAQIWRI